ncbi:MAG: ABC transporter ATP-binding protein [Actinomycetales bacterium]|nr:ABC transporter ATP-binding protein [Actinomycetales bacterium]
MSLLSVEAIDICYGDFQAIYGIDVSVNEGETLAIVGANGAGKSTLLKAIAGVMTPKEGKIIFNSQDITAVPAHRRVAAGISLTPEGRRIFPSMSVEENLKIGGYSKRKGPWNLTSVFDAIPLVSDIRSKQGRSLSGGEQQATAIARALMSNPRLLLLDEVSLGLAPVAVEGIYEALPSITSQGTTVLIVEQDLHHALKVADRIQCLLEGRTALEGPASSFTREQLTKAYFGV